MTSQREAQRKENLLLDLYKINAYIPNDAEGSPLTPFGNFAEGYRVGQSAQSDQAANIAQLQLDNAKLREALEYADRLIPYNHIITASLAKDKP